MYAWVYKKSLQHNDIWKKYFAELLLQFIDKEVFPEDVKTALMKHIPRISSSDFLDIVLTRTLLAYNKPCEKAQDLVLLTDLPQDTHYVYTRSLFIKQQKLRKYYLCKEIKTNRMFKYHPLAKVKPMVD